MPSHADIQAIQCTLTDAVKSVLADELFLRGIVRGTLYIGPSGVIPGQWFLLLVGSGYPAFSRSASFEEFQSPQRARVAMAAYLCAALACA